MTRIHNIPYADIAIGTSCQFSKTLTEQDLQLFAQTSGDCNPLHLDADYAATTNFGERIAHGMWSGALISAAIATRLPGPGSIYRSQSLKFSNPVRLGDTVTITLTVIDKKDRTRVVTLNCSGSNQNGEIIVKGEAEVIAAAESISFSTT